MKPTVSAGTRPVSELMASVLLAAHRENRLFLYCWERDTLLWLHACRERGYGVHNNWTVAFIELNLEAIKAERYPVDFNLRAARERKEMA